jgi:hypothetical protein
MPHIELPKAIAKPTEQPSGDEALRHSAISIDFPDTTMQDSADSTPDEFQDISPKMEKLLWHYRLGHTPFSVINQTAKDGDLPSRLATASDPICTSCIYGQSVRRPWRTKLPTTPIGERRPIRQPGDCVSIDQMESPVPGLIAQLKGIPTRDRYNCATIFVDHYSDVSYVHLQSTLTAEETLQAKQSFERWAQSHGVTIKHYHADNGRFAETTFMADIAKCGQTISFCGVNAHFQMGEQRDAYAHYKTWQEPNYYMQ